MLSLVFAGSLLAVQPPALPPEPAPAPAPAVVEGPAPAPAPAPDPIPDAIVVAPVEGALPVAEEVSAPIVVAPGPGDAAVVSGNTVVFIDGDAPFTSTPVDIQARTQAIPLPPWSGAGRFVGGAAILTAGLGLLTAATFEFSNGFDTTRPLISQVPAGVTMLVAGGVMIGTGIRDQRRLGEWEAATKIKAKPMGTGLIVGGVTAISLGSMAAIATSIAADMDLNAPRSIPAGWATAGVTLGTGTALLLGGIVRRARYGKWRKNITGMPMIAPTRAGATVGLVGQF